MRSAATWALVWHGAVLPSILSVATFNAANGLGAPAGQVQTGHIGGHCIKVGIVGHHVGVETMWPNVVLAPDTLHRHEGHAQQGGQAGLIRCGEPSIVKHMFRRLPTHALFGYLRRTRVTLEASATTTPS